MLPGMPLALPQPAQPATAAAPGAPMASALMHLAGVQGALGQQQQLLAQGLELVTGQPQNLSTQQLMRNFTGLQQFAAQAQQSAAQAQQVLAQFMLHPPAPAGAPPPAPAAQHPAAIGQQSAVAEGPAAEAMDGLEATAEAAAAAAGAAAGSPTEVVLAQNRRKEIRAFFHLRGVSDSAVDQGLAALKGRIMQHSKAHPKFRCSSGRLLLPGIDEALCPLVAVCRRNNSDRASLIKEDSFRVRQSLPEGGGSAAQRGQLARLPQLLPAAFLALLSAEQLVAAGLEAGVAAARCELVLDYEDTRGQPGVVAMQAKLVWGGSGGEVQQATA